MGSDRGGIVSGRRFVVWVYDGLSWQAEEAGELPEGQAVKLASYIRNNFGLSAKALPVGVQPQAVAS